MSVETKPNHDSAGRFKKGNNANPGGRPKTAHLRKYILDQTNDLRDIIESLVTDMNNKQISVSNRISIRKLLMEYAAGKPHQTQTIEHEKPIPIEFIKGTDDDTTKVSSSN